MTMFMFICLTLRYLNVYFMLLRTHQFEINCSLVASIVKMPKTLSLQHSATKFLSLIAVVFLLKALDHLM